MNNDIQYPPWQRQYTPKQQKILDKMAQQAEDAYQSSNIGKYLQKKDEIRSMLIKPLHILKTRRDVQSLSNSTYGTNLVPPVTKKQLKAWPRRLIKKA